MERSIIKITINSNVRKNDLDLIEKYSSNPKIKKIILDILPDDEDDRLLLCKIKNIKTFNQELFLISKFSVLKICLCNFTGFLWKSIKCDPSLDQDFIFCGSDEKIIAQMIPVNDYEIMYKVEDKIYYRKKDQILNFFKVSLSDREISDEFFFSKKILVLELKNCKIKKRFSLEVNELYFERCTFYTDFIPNKKIEKLFLFDCETPNQKTINLFGKFHTDLSFLNIYNTLVENFIRFKIYNLTDTKIRIENQYPENNFFVK